VDDRAAEGAAAMIPVSDEHKKIMGHMSGFDPASLGEAGYLVMPIRQKDGSFWQLMLCVDMDLDWATKRCAATIRARRSDLEHLMLCKSFHPAESSKVIPQHTTSADIVP
jgi:hypothetical protein